MPNLRRQAVFNLMAPRNICIIRAGAIIIFVFIGGQRIINHIDDKPNVGCYTTQIFVKSVFCRCGEAGKRSGRGIPAAGLQGLFNA